MKETIKFMVNHDVIRVVAFNNDQTFDKLKPAVYSVDFNDFLGFHLKSVQSNFDLPEKLYGNVVTRAAKVMDTFESRNSSTGVLLTGDAGSGKTLLTKYLCHEMILKGYPVIMVNNPFSGDEFNKMINDIGPCVLLFDEFAKVYGYSSNGSGRGNSTISKALELGPSRNLDSNQTNLLSFMDGTVSNKRLLLFTENNEFSINEHMMNRPGRIYYHFRYKKVEEAIIHDLGKDKGLSSKMIDDIVMLSRRSFNFSYDILQTIIEEYTRYGSSLKEIVEDLNMESPYSMITRYRVKSLKQGENDLELYKGSTKILGEYDDYVEYVRPGDEDREPERRRFEHFNFDSGNLMYEDEHKVIHEDAGISLVLEKVHVSVDADKYSAF